MTHIEQSADVSPLATIGTLLDVSHEFPPKNSVHHEPLSLRTPMPYASSSEHSSVSSEKN